MEELIKERNALREISRSLNAALRCFEIEKGLEHLSSSRYDDFYHVKNELRTLCSFINSDYNAVLSIIKRVTR